MITTGAKWWLGVAGLALVAAVAWLLFSDGELLGMLVLLALAVATTVLGVLAVITRDFDAGDGARPLTPPRLPAGWPVLAALGIGVSLVGLAAGGALLYVGLGILAVAVVEWMVQAWAERATDDPAENGALRNRIMFPLEIPALAAVAVVAILLGFSRVLLALPEAGATVVAIAVAILVLAGAALLASRPRISASLLTGLLVVGGVGLLGGGIVGAVVGERDFEEHEEEEAEAEAEAEREEVVISASGTDGFDEDEVRIPADRPVTIVFENREDDRPHGLLIQGLEEGDVATGVVAGGESATVELEAPPGEYTFVDSEFPNELQGTLIAEEEVGAGPGTEGGS